MNRTSWRKALLCGAQITRDCNRKIEQYTYREVAEIALHLAAESTGEYDDALADGRAMARIVEEHTNLKAAGII